MAKYADAIRWIATEDSPGDDPSIEELGATMTVCLVADLWKQDPNTVATDVYKLRHPKGKS